MDDRFPKIHTVTIINTVDFDAAIWTTSFSSPHKANSYLDAVVNWIKRHGMDDVLKVETDCMELDSEEYLDWLEEEYGNK